MEEFLSTIRSAPLFSGVSEAELTAMLACLKAEKKTSRRERLRKEVLSLGFCNRPE